jgi:hypothetical protein
VIKTDANDDQDQQGPAREQLLKDFQAMLSMKNKDFLFKVFFFSSSNFHVAASAASVSIRHSKDCDCVSLSLKWKHSLSLV